MATLTCDICYGKLVVSAVGIAICADHLLSVTPK